MTKFKSKKSSKFTLINMKATRMAREHRAILRRDLRPGQNAREIVRLVPLCSCETACACDVRLGFPMCP
jgi:hypothetical protein